MIFKYTYKIINLEIKLLKNEELNFRILKVLDREMNKQRVLRNLTFL